LIYTNTNLFIVNDSLVLSLLTSSPPCPSGQGGEDVNHVNS
jgi:hypothetical protein